MFKYPAPEQIMANAKWSQEWMRAYGVKRQHLCSALEAEMNMEIVRRTIFTRRPTATGQAIWNRVKSSNRNYHIITYRSRMGEAPGYPCFDSDSPTPGEGTIFVDLDLTMKLQETDSSGLNSAYDVILVFLHELGHAKQFDERPGEFSAIALGGADADKRQITASWQKSLLQVGGKTRTEAAKRAKQLVEELFNGKSYIHARFPDPIERDNYLRHEGPICDEWKLMRRGAYINAYGHYGAAGAGQADPAS